MREKKHNFNNKYKISNAWDDIFYDPVIANAILDRIFTSCPCNSYQWKIISFKKDHIKEDDESKLHS